MVYFSKLKLYGFKSFVDKTELEIGAGLNGIVGPNGCGKSNLVEALRWVMGEKSAKNMRGGGMEDVIFAGTSKRPARNMAEVTVVMNNEDGSAPAPFTASTEIEINRRIEKDKGSQFRVNGKAVRARDVNLLFADTMTGASSPALVSQGRITEIIVAKPSDRRRILEESAGISGLHTRRHEAELRLRAAEQNLTRLNDTLADMRTRLSSLKRQARQAERYKELSDSIRRLELALSWSEWSSIHSKIKSDRADFAAHNDTVQEALTETKRLSLQLETLDNALPEKRKQAIEAQAILQNFRVSLERLEQDIQTKTKGLQDAIEAKHQLEKDSEFTQSQLDQTLLDMDASKTSLATLETDAIAYPDQIALLETDLARDEAIYAQCLGQKQSIETAMAVAKESRSNSDAQLSGLKNALDKSAANIAILTQAMAESQDKLQTIQSDPILDIKLDDIDADILSLQSTLVDDTTRQSTLVEKIHALKSKKNEVISKLSAMEGEYNGLQSLINRATQDETIPQGDAAMINHIQVEKGYEKALSSALGQWATTAGMDDTASVYWSGHHTIVVNPAGTNALSNFVTAPDALAPLLNAVGIVETLPDTSQNLAAGQIIIAKDGSFIRWDGLRVQADAVQSTDTTSMLLEQKNRVADLITAIATQKTHLQDLDTQLDALNIDEAAISTLLAQITQDLSGKETFKRDTGYQQDRLNDQRIALNEKYIEQQERLVQNTTEQAQLQAQYKALEDKIKSIDESSTNDQHQQLQDLLQKITVIQTQLNDTRQSLAEAKQKQSSATAQINALRHQIERNGEESIKLNTRLDEFSARQDTIDAKIIAYQSTKNDNSDDLREGLLSKIANQDQILRDITLVLEGLENDNKRLQIDLRQAESASASAREKRAIAQTNVSNAETDLKNLEHRIYERFEVSPQHLEEQVFSLFNDQIPDLADLQNEKETVTRQRDSIGPVNLRAALECDETETQLADLENEYNDLTKAIEQLRGGIAKLNREAKDRLAIAFQRVDQHFQALFSQLFEGGKAYLEMIQNDDPLESGLEIYAQPPGKALQKLSLLSGGEQTLTATALIFGMFLTNPSPICVLDEIDAPLDDANVDRVCSLMEKIAADTDTRFIVITHHRMTMARMDRLYGVTMSERGVSQLVSVDMALQAELELSESA